MGFNKSPLTRLVAMSFLCLPFMLSLSIAQSTVVTLEQIQCSYNADSKRPNPFGSRAFVTVTQSGSDTTFRYESFPGLIQFPDRKDVHSPRVVTLEKSRTMVFYNTQIEVARKVMRLRKDYYYELIGYKDEIGFAAYDDAMSCE